MASDPHFPLSVILSAYNQPVWLEKVLWGYSVQDFKDFEIVVADDGSTAETQQVIARLRELTGMAIQHVWQSDEGFRKCLVLNHAIESANGEYLVFSDGDCIPRRDFLAVHMANRNHGRFLSGGAVRLPLELSQAITTADIVAGKPFQWSWLLQHADRASRPRFSRLIRASSKGILAKALNHLTTTKPTWNGNNASAYKADIIAVNGMDERMAYGGEDCELGERLVNAGLNPMQLRFSAALVHLEHGRSYISESAVEHNETIREQTRDNRTTWTDYGILSPANRDAADYVVNGCSVQRSVTKINRSSRRLFIIDSDILRPGGHQVEIADVMATAASKTGYQPVIVTHGDFCNANAFAPQVTVRPLFRFALVRKWSLGVDGKSLNQRDLTGKIVSGGSIGQQYRRTAESLSIKTPAVALDSWSDDFARWLQEAQPSENDRLIFPTACDFTLLCVAAALQKTSFNGSMRMDFLFHFTLFDGREGERHGRQQAVDSFAKQIDSTLRSLDGHEIRLLATTKELARQLNQAVGRELWQAIDYPIRRQLAPRVDDDPDKRSRLMLAGCIRREKGRYEISQLTTQLWNDHLKPGDWQLAFQLPTKRWRRLLPKHIWSRADEFRDNDDRELQFQDEVLDPVRYKRWINTATLGMFLYDPRRYYTRCSCVLLEMLMAGVPVIVPMNCWLSHQIQGPRGEHIDSIWHCGLPTKMAGRVAMTSPTKATFSLSVEPSTSALAIAFPEVIAEGDAICVEANFRVAGELRPKLQAKYAVEPRSSGRNKLVIALPQGTSEVILEYKRIIDQKTPLSEPDIRVVQTVSPPPESAVGMIATDVSQVPRLLREFDRNRIHYKQSAMAFASLVTEKHSPERFVRQLWPTDVHSQVTVFNRIGNVRQAATDAA